MGCKQSKTVRSISNNTAAQEQLRSVIIDKVTLENEIEIHPKTTNIIQVDSEVTTDCKQEVEPPQKPEISPDITDISDEKITYYVHKALEIFLPDYHIDCYDDTPDTLPPCLTRTYVMQVKSNSNVTLYPDQTGEFLNYSIQPTTDRLHVCFERSDPTQVKFLYQVRAGLRTFVSSPFHGQNTPLNSAVPCSQVPITEALNGEDPIEGIVEALGQIQSDSVEPNGFDGNDFLWKKHGNAQNFTIGDNTDGSNHGNFYWKSIGSSSNGGVLMTDQKSKKLQLNLIELSI